MSGSADTTVKLWDLNNGVCARNFGFHQDKVSAGGAKSVEGNTCFLVAMTATLLCLICVSATTLVAGPGRLRATLKVSKWGNNGQDFYVYENGIIHKFDARMENQSVWKLQAHDSEVTCFDLSPIVDGYMVSGSSDKTIKPVEPGCR